MLLLSCQKNQVFLSLCALLGETRAAHGELESFDRINMGVNWGFAHDPYAFIRLHYNPARETIFLLDELYALRITNSETADQLLTRGYTDAVITCDSAEPKSVADYRRLSIASGPSSRFPASFCAFPSMKPESKSLPGSWTSLQA